jgi:surface antigen
MIAISLQNRYLRSTILALVPAAMLAGCTASEQRTGVLTGGGALAGGLVGYAVGGTRGAAIGAIAGGALGLATGLYLDAKEREEAQLAALAAARTGSISSRSFRNNSGNNVRVTSRPVRTYAEGGTRYRDVEKTVVRDGKEVGKETVKAREVKLAGGKTEWAVDS